MMARVFDFHIERTRRRPYADFGMSSLEALVQMALQRADVATMDLIVAEIKRRRASQELAK